MEQTRSSGAVRRGRWPSKHGPGGVTGCNRGGDLAERFGEDGSDRTVVVAEALGNGEAMYSASWTGSASAPSM